MGLHSRRKISMNKAELIAAVAEKAELSKKDAEKAVKALTDVISEELVKGEKIQLVGFGTFEVSERAAREGRNPKSGEVMSIPASKTPKFKAGKALKDMVNE
ncbi:MAG: HU family DNA-binding protein [Lacrimispora sp.]